MMSASGHLLFLLVIREYLQITGGASTRSGPAGVFGSPAPMWRRQVQLSG